MTTTVNGMALEAITQNAFQRKRGIYMTEMFTAPPIHRIEGLELPLASVAHYLPEEDKDYSPDESWWLIRGMQKNANIWVEHLLEFNAGFGKVKKLPGSPANWVRKFHQKHPDLKRVVNRKTALATETSLLVINHALARHWYEYHNNRYLGYQIARNTRDNVVREVATMVKEVDRVHFIPLSMPSKLYELGKIKTANKEMPELQIESIRRFGTVAGLFFLDLWRFIEDPKLSVLGTEIEEQHWKRVNLMLTCNGSWFMLNLADLNSWVRRDAVKESPLAAQKPGTPVVEATPAKEGKWAVDRVQRIFLNDLIQLIEHATVFSKKTSGVDVSQQPTDDAESNSSIGLIKEQTTQVLGSNIANLVQSKINPEFKDGLSDPENPEGESLLTKGRDRQNKDADRLKRFSLDSRASKKPDTPAPLKADEQIKPPVVKVISDEEIDSNVEALEQVDAIIESPDYTMAQPHRDPLEATIVTQAHKLAKDGIISAAGLKAAEKLAVAYKGIPNPFGDGLAFEACQVTQEETVVEAKKIPTRSKRIFDDSMNFSTIEDVTTKYVRNTYKKDLVNVALATQKSGIAVVGIEADQVDTISGSQLIMLIRTKGINGNQSTLPVVLPAFEEDGTYMSGGTRYRLKNQRVDAPIRKVRPTLVYLTSYYGKISVSRSDKVVFDYGEWLRNKIAAMEIDGHPLIKGSEHNNVFDQSVIAPIMYTTMARRFKSLRLGDFSLLFDRKEIERTFSEAERRKHEMDGSVIAGVGSNNTPVIMTASNEILVDGKSRGSLEEILSIDTSSAPHGAAMVSIKGQSLPLGVVIASYIGLSKMIAHLGNKVRRVQAGQRQELMWYESPIKFVDETLIVDTRDQRTSLLMMGFKQYNKQIRQLSVYGFDKSHSYQHLFDANSRSSQYSIELEILNERFVDPMTERMLKEMKEPTEWQGLLWRSLELLTTDFSPDEMDGRLMNIKLHERIPGLMYAELTKSIRRYKSDSRVAKASLDMKPTAVWHKITSDAAISPVNDCNPIADLRAQEAVTYIGHGGRSKRSMVAKNRKFHKNDAGNISMDTVDSGDTGINIYMSANPNVKNTGGRSEPGSASATGVSSMVSTTMLLGPCLDIDDPRRGVFASIQVGSGVAAKGYRPLPLATGYEEILAGRVGKKFAYVATGKGKVLSIRNEVMRVEYENGIVDAIEVGLVLTGGEGHTYPNNVVVTVKAGDTFEAGDGLAFNDSWFEQSPHDPRLLIFKQGVPTWVMLSENINTLEDGSVISPALGAALHAQEIEPRELVFPFSYTIHNLVTLGTIVDPDTILCTIESASTAAAELFSEQTVDRLNLIADNAPRAKYHGKVERIEIRYNGDIEDMSESLAKLTEESDKRIRLKAKDMGKNIDGGRTDESQRVDGQPLQVDTLVIRIFINHGADAAAGDKGVLGNQLKTVHGQVAVAPIVTESGREIGINYSDNGVEARVVRGPRKWGIYNACLVTTGSRFVKAYRGK